MWMHWFTTCRVVIEVDVIQKFALSSHLSEFVILVNLWDVFRHVWLYLLLFTQPIYGSLFLLIH
jgi:hypothetical protein